MVLPTLSELHVVLHNDNNLITFIYLYLEIPQETKVRKNRNLSENYDAACS